MQYHIIIAALITTLSNFAGAHEATVAVAQPFVRATVPQQKATGAFMTLRAAHEARLVGATSPVAGHVEIHEMKMEGDIMKMRQIPSLALPADKDVALAPGGYHLMLLDLRQQLQPAQTVPITLTIDFGNGQRKDIAVNAPVQALGAGSPAPANGKPAAANKPHSHAH